MGALNELARFWSPWQPAYWLLRAATQVTRADLAPRRIVRARRRPRVLPYQRAVPTWEPWVLLPRRSQGLSRCRTGVAPWRPRSPTRRRRWAPRWRPGRRSFSPRQASPNRGRRRADSVRGRDCEDSLGASACHSFSAARSEGVAGTPQRSADAGASEVLNLRVTPRRSAFGSDPRASALSSVAMAWPPVAVDGIHAARFQPNPCGTWPRPVGDRADEHPWVVDPQADAIRRLPHLRPSERE